MRKLLALASVAAIAVSAPAIAAPFSGPYVGGQIGSDNTDIKVVVPGELVADGISAHGIEGGVFAGYDHAIARNTFIGLEAQFSLSDNQFALALGDTDVRARANYNFGVSARIGQKLSEKTALYARLGWNEVHQKLVVNGEQVYSQNKDGVLLGGGLETYATKRTSIRLEYDYTMYGTIVNYQDVAAIKSGNQKITLGFAYHF